MFTNLHTLRIRYPMPWLQDGRLLADIVPRCTRLEHLYLGHVRRAEADQLRALVVPSLVSLHLKVEDYRRNALYGLPLDGDTLPLSACPKLRTLSLAGFLDGISYSGQLFTNESTPPDLRALRISIPGGAIDNFAPEFPTLETLYLNVRKTTGRALLTSIGVPRLQHLHIEGHVYASPQLHLLYQSLVAHSVHLRYLRIKLEGWCEHYQNGDSSLLMQLDGYEADHIDDLKSQIGLIMGHADMWFCEVPHDADPPPGWTKKVIAQSRWCYADMIFPRNRLVRHEAQHYDADHMRTLERNRDTIFQEFDAMDAHPDVAGGPEEDVEGSDDEEA